MPLLTKVVSELDPEVSLPDNDYEFASLDGSLLSVTKSGVIKSADKLGQSTITTTDTRATDNQVKTNVKVVEPWSIRLVITEDNKQPDSFFESYLPWIFRRQSEEKNFDNNWNLVLGRQYFIRAEVLDDTGARITLAESTNLDWKIPSSLKVIKTKGQELLVSALEKKAQDHITAELTGIKHSTGVYKPKRKVLAEQQLAIFSPIALIKPADKVLLPASKRLSMPLSAVGGSGKYEYSTLNISVATSDYDGSIRGQAPGRTTLRVADRLNAKNFDTLEVEVEIAAKNEFLERHKEIEQGQISDTVLYLTTQDGRKFTYCYGVDFIPVSGSVLQDNYRVRSKSLTNTSSAEFGKELSQNSLKSVFYKRRLELGVEPALLQSAEDNWYKFSKYEQLGELTKAQYLAIANSYRTFGMCGKVDLEGLKVGEAQHNVNSVIVSTQVEQLVRVVSALRTTEPALELSSVFAPDGNYLVAPKSKLVWSLSGGYPLWANGNRTPQEKIVVQNDEKSSENLKAIIILSKQEDQKAVAELNCGSALTPSTHTVVFTRQNQADEYLIFPLEIRGQLKVRCALPSRYELFEISEKLQPFSTSHARKDIFTSQSVRKGQHYQLQTWLYNSASTPFYSFNGLFFDARIKQTQTGSFKLKRIIDTAIIGLFDFLAEVDPSRAILTFFTEGFALGAKDFTQVYKELTIEGLEITQLHPAEKTILLVHQAQYRIQVTRGSGKFIVTSNDTSLATVKQENSTSLLVTPLRVGDVLFTLEDTGLTHGVKTTSLLRIRSASGVRLTISQPLIPTLASTNAQVVLLDSDGHAFDHDQLAHVELSVLEILSGNAQSKLGFQKLPQGQFIITGNQAGEYQLAAKAALPISSILDRTGAGIGYLTSETVMLEIFSGLRATPAAIHFTTECVTAVRIEGGPSALAYTRQNLSITLVPERQDDDQLVVVTARETSYNAHRPFFNVKSRQKLGSTKLKFVLQDSNKKVLATVEVPVLIGEVASFRIRGTGNRKIHVDAPVRLIAEGMIGEKLMTPCDCRFNFDWKVKDKGVLQLGNRLLANASQLDYTPQLQGIHLMAINATALIEGTAEIELVVKRSFTPEGYLGYFKNKVESLSATLSVQSIQPMAVYSPTYVSHSFEKNNHIIMPIGSTWQVVTKVPAKYLDFRITHSSPLHNFEVTTQGEISAGSAWGEAVLAITDNQNTDQVTYVNIKTAEIHSILIEDSYKCELMGLHVEMKLKINLQNENGFLFPQPLR